MPDVQEQKNIRTMMPLVSASFEPGKAKEYVEAIEDPEERELAWADYYQYTGNAEEAVERARPFLDHEDPALRLSAHIVCFISGLAIGDAAGAREILLDLEKIQVPDDIPVSGTYCANILKIMLYMHEDEFDVGDEIPESLPEGTKFFTCYFLALREYLRDDYGKAIGMANAALTMGGKRYPIAAIYLRIICAASLVHLKRQEEAEQHYNQGLEIALPDGLLGPFAQQYVMLAGLNKKILKPISDEKYKQLSKYADVFIPAWINAHDTLVDWYADHGLTKTEHVAAMLFRKGFGLKEISAIMGISVNTIKRHISSIYRKTNTKKRHHLPKKIIR